MVNENDESIAQGVYQIKLHILISSTFQLFSSPRVMPIHNLTKIIEKMMS